MRLFAACFLTFIIDAMVAGEYVETLNLQCEGETIATSTLQLSQGACEAECDNNNNCTVYQHESATDNCTLLTACTSAYYCQCNLYVKAGTNGCYGTPCENGVCNNLTCNCTEGYTGTQCETDMDECESSPCVNGACSDRLNGYSCLCHEGYSGDQCQINIDECESDPCQNGGECNDTVNGYLCLCQGGYTGVECHVEIDECMSDPCTNEGVCTDLVNGYTCQCNDSFTGDRCQLMISHFSTDADNVLHCGMKCYGDMSHTCDAFRYEDGTCDVTIITRDEEVAHDVEGVACRMTDDLRMICN